MQRFDTMFDTAKIFVPDVHEDDRGFFKETYHADRYRAEGLADDFVQDSVSFSTKNVIRGLHYDPEMSKFVQVLHKQLYIPAGFAHGFLALSDDVVFAYKHGALYNPKREGAIRWNDPDLAIAWPLCGEPRISQKDRQAALFSSFRDRP